MNLLSVTSCYAAATAAFPLIGGLGSECAQRAAGDEMALQVESVVHGGMGGEKALSGSG